MVKDAGSNVVPVEICNEVFIIPASVIEWLFEGRRSNWRPFFNYCEITQGHLLILYSAPFKYCSTGAKPQPGPSLARRRRPSP